MENLTKTEQKIFDSVSFNPQTAKEIKNVSNFCSSYQKLTAILFKLIVKGLIRTETVSVPGQGRRQVYIRTDVDVNI